ncbi:MAG: 30S ribosomal protein S3 [Candidatus Onthovivens sp.]|nr:30S ribosomal protein S3 [Candidatus Onthovivens sp.]
MGQKVNPVGMRVGINKNWNSRWFASNKDYSNFLIEDNKIRNYIEKNLDRQAFLSHIEIERKKTNKGHLVIVQIHVARPGVVIGQDGATINALRKNLVKLTNNENIKVDVVEVKQPSLDAKIVSLQIAKQLEERASFRIVQKKALTQVRKAGAKGVKTAVSGRLAGADIARSEGYKDGTMAINTLRSDIDYAISEAMTTYGKLGVKVWICRGEVEENRPTTAENKKGE